MVKPLAICMEALDARPGSGKYLRCVALPGRQPGLRLDGTGRVLWRSDDGASCELWVTADGRLALYRQEGMDPVTLRRAGRSLDVPEAKPVIVVDQDRIDVGERRLRVHVHGEAPAVAAPSPLSARPRRPGRLAQAMATAAIIGAVATAGGCTDADGEGTPTIQVRDDPPEITAPPPPTPENSIVDAVKGEWTAVRAYDVKDEGIWITGTLTIGEDSYAFTSIHEISATSGQRGLDFLLTRPRAEVFIYPWSGLTEYNVFEGFVPGDVLVGCTFYTGRKVLGEFQVRVGDSGSLILTDPTSDDDPWRVTKQLRVETEE